MRILDFTILFSSIIGVGVVWVLASTSHINPGYTPIKWMFMLISVYFLMMVAKIAGILQT
jgi:hypothetical protein